MRIRLLYKVVFYLFGTFLHELAHYVAAVILGKAEGFSLIPRIEERSFVFGRVKSRVKYRVLSSFVATAPLVWWAVLLLILWHLRLIGISLGKPELHPGILTRQIQAFTVKDGLFIWLFLQMLWAGMLSTEDVRNFFKGLLSVSGIILIAAFAVLVYFSRNFL
jgi:hypothetical protein